MNLKCTGSSLNWCETDAFIRYLLTNIDTSVNTTDEGIMDLYSSLVEDKRIRDKMMANIRTELERTRRMLLLILEKPISERRINHYYSTMLRATALDYLHHSQVSLLSSWRGRKRRKAFTACSGVSMPLRMPWEIQANFPVRRFNRRPLTIQVTKCL